MPLAEPQPNATAAASHLVEEGDLASSLATEPGESFLPVLSTPRMIASMELAAARILAPLLAPGETSVGASVQIEHLAATFPGGTFHATARFVGREGKLYVFEVTAADERGPIGRGIHKRAIVDAERFLARTRSR